MENAIEGWKDPQKILVVLAHPDDPEYFCGASIARWSALGHKVAYCLLTRGDKGVRGEVVNTNLLTHTREIEQRRAAKVLGVEGIRFLDFEDGYLQPNLEARKAIVSVLREEKPDIVVTSDPTTFFHRDDRLNHPDHRIAGQIVCEAIFPACGNPMFFPELLGQGLAAHTVRELWLTLTREPNLTLDVTNTWELKIEALRQHRSQLADPVQMEKNQRQRRTVVSSEKEPKYIDEFRRIVFR